MLNSILKNYLDDEQQDIIKYNFLAKELERENYFCLAQIARDIQCEEQTHSEMIKYMIEKLS